jgi:gluconolactonase
MIYPTIGEVVREDSRLDELISPEARIEVLASGFEWSEGPIWLRDEGCLLFSDIPHNVIYRWSEEAGLSEWMKPSGYTGVEDYGAEPGSNGLTVDSAGRLVLCEHGDRRVSLLTPGGGKLTLADRYQGRRLNSPNDVVVKSDGSIYFTDPPYGLPQRWEDPRRELDFCGVYRLDPSGELRLLHADLTRPNGLAFSPDERLLYVANSDPDHAVWKRFVVQEDGSLDEGVVFVDVTDLVGAVPGLPDGLKVDRSGNLFATAPGGVHVYDPEGNRLGRIDTGIATANCAWGDDGSTLYLCSDMYLCRIRTRTRGAGW